MKRKLSRQIFNERRTNSWLVVELLIISVVVWYLVNSFLIPTRIQHMPNGYDMSETVQLTYRSFPDKMEALPEDSAERINTKLDLFAALINNIKSRPSVEEVAIGARVMPFNYNAWNTALRDPVNTDSFISSGLNLRVGTPETPRVMKLQPLAGAETVEDLVRILENGQLIISRSVGRNLAGLAENDWYGDGLKGSVQFIGKEVLLNGDVYTVGAVVEDMRRGEYEPANSGSAIMPIRMNRPSILNQPDVVVRVRPGMMDDFLNDFKEHGAEFYRNDLFYVTECKTADEIKASHHLQNTIEKRNNAIIIIFLLVTIFLGLLGTFWFRTNQRISEIAIRMSAGARRSDIFRRLISEGLLMLVVASVPAAVIDWYLFAKVDDGWPFYDSLFTGGSWGHLALCYGITFLLMAVMVVVGIAFPARRAMQIDPAMALHAE